MKEATLGPTSANRFYSLDVLRGFAVLGILLVNISWFAFPTYEIFDSKSSFVETPGIEPWGAGLMAAFVSGKFRMLLAMIFGIGLYLQYRKRKAMWCPPPPLPGERPLRNPHWPGPYVRRTLFLAGIGLCHFLFLWLGDILFALAATALVAMLFVEVSHSKIKWWLVGLGAVNLLAGLGLALLLWAIGAMAGPTDVKYSQDFAFFGFTELGAFQHGHYLHQLLFRALLLPFLIFGVPLYVPSLLFAFLIGLLLAKTGYLDDPASRPDVFRKCMLLCLFVGLPLNLLGGWGAYAEWEFPIFFVTELFAAPLLSLGLLVLGIRFLRGCQPLLFQPLAKVGKVALSTYLMQTVICTTIFYSWGFGWFGWMTFPQLLMVVVGVWAANVVMAYAWLRFFDIGPVEWAWRSLSEGRKLPWRGSASVM